MRRALIAVAALALAGCGSAHRATAPPSASDAPRPVVVGGCDGLYYELPGRPQVVLVSDLPLEAPVRTAMQQMTEAIKLTLKDHGFRAGRFRVGYVVCDDSGANGHYDASRCAANARAAARVANVVGVIGTLDSACTRAELPIMRRAGIAMVGPLNTADDLTHAGASFARLSAPNSAQAAAAVAYIRAQGARSVAVLSDGSPAGDVYARAFRAFAGREGMRVVARGSAEAAYVAGGVPERAGPLLRAARARASGGPIVLPETLGPASLLAAVVGSDAEGVLLAVSGAPVERLGAAGRAFAAHFEQVLGAAPHPYAAYAAQAAAVLLDAVARSDGTRVSVARAVLNGRARGPLGTITFTPNGDPTPAPVTIFRVHGGEARLVRVVDPGVP